MSEPTTVCPNCGSAVDLGDRFCQACGAEISMPPAGAGAVALTSASGSASIATYPGADPLLTFDVEYPASLSRWKIFVKWLLAIPHLVALYFLAIAVVIVVLIAWFAILILGRFPRGLWDFVLMFMRWNANVYAYLLLQRDEYPPFGDGPYPARLDLEYPESLSRWKIFLKWLLVIPNAFVYAFVALAAFVALVVGWFAILITGSMPKGIFDFITGERRWSYRLFAYSFLMTDRYPPFSLDQ